MSLQDALKRASEKAQREQKEQLRDLYVEYHSSLYSTAAAYDNAIILGGFAAFFALWAGTADDLPRLARLVTVALMGVSLMAYVAVTVGQMLLRQWHLEWRRGELFGSHWNDPEKFIDAWDAIGADYDRRSGTYLRAFLGGFWISLLTGFCAALILAYNALAVAFGWPVLTG